MTIQEKKTDYPQFYISRLEKKWPFSLKLASDLFRVNDHGLYFSLQEFFVCAAFDLKDDDNGIEDSSDEKESIEEMDIWYISIYPGFFIKDNKVHYEERVESKVPNSTKKESIIKIYTLDHIPYQTIVCEAAKFYINSFFQGSVVSGDAEVLNLLSEFRIWSPVFYYLLFTTYSFSMKKMLEKQNFRKNNEKRILKAFHSEF